MKSKKVMNKLNSEIKQGRYILGVAVGAGISARSASEGGADFLLSLNSGKFRQMGLGSLGGYLSNANSNQFVMDFSLKEILPRVKNIPVLFGLNATDPTIDLRSYINLIKDKGFAGINNYPTVGLFDGKFYNHLKEDGISYDEEVEAIKIAHEMGLFTVAFVFNEYQAEEMVDAGADVICVHLGLTKGGDLGASKVLSLSKSKELVNNIFNLVKKKTTSILKMVYGGPIQNKSDIQFIYNNTSCDGYIGGSTFERIPSEEAIHKTTIEFKYMSSIEDPILEQLNRSIDSPKDYVKFILKYIEFHYSESISLKDLSEILHVSSEYLSRLFKKEKNISFKEYLISYRLDKFIDIMIKYPNLSMKEGAIKVGYFNYVHFSKLFKKRKNISPKNYFISYKHN